MPWKDAHPSGRCCRRPTVVPGSPRRTAVLILGLRIYLAVQAIRAAGQVRRCAVRSPFLLASRPSVPLRQFIAQTLLHDNALDYIM